MADTHDGVEVKLGADTTDATRGLDAASTSIQSSLTSINNTLKSFGSTNKSTMDEAVKNNADLSRSFLELKASATGGFNAIAGVIERFRGVLGTLAAALVGGAIFKSSIGAVLDLEDAVRGLEIQFGMSAEAATKQAIALKIAGISTETYEMMAQRLEMRLRLQSDEFDRLKVVYKDSSGALLPLDQILKNVYARMQDFKAGTDQQLFAMTLLGRNAREFAGEMQRLEASEADAAKMAEKFGDSMGASQQQRVEEYRRKINEFDLTLDHLKMTVGVIVLPWLEKLADWFTVGIEKITAGISRLSLASRNNLSALEAEAGGVEGLRNAMAALPGSIDSALAAYRRMEHEGPPIPGSGKESFTAKPKPGEDTRLAEMKEKLEQMKEAEGYFHELSYAEEAAYWTRMLALVKGEGAKDIALRREIAHLRYEANKAGAKESLSDTIASIHEQEEADRGSKDAQIRDAEGLTALMKSIYGEQSANYKKALDEELKIRAEWAKKEEALIKDAEKFHIEVLKEATTEEEAYLNQQVALRSISAEQKIAIEKNMASQIYAAELDEVNSYIATLAVGTLAYQQALEKRAILTLQYNAKINQLDYEAQQQREQNAVTAANDIQSAFATAFDQIAMNTKKLSDVFKQMVTTITSDLTKLAANDVAKQLFGAGTTGGNALTGLMSKIFGGGAAGASSPQVVAETANTTALTALTTAMVSLNSTMAASSIGGGLGIGGGTSSGGGGVSSIFSDVAGMTDMVGFESGTPYVPQTSLAIVHRGERIVPASQNQSYAYGGTRNNFMFNGPVDSRTQAQMARVAARESNRARMRG